MRALFLCQKQYPQRLKPIHLYVWTDGLKPVPFTQEFFPQPVKAASFHPAGFRNLCGSG
jgi:hypothetical protein